MFVGSETCECFCTENGNDVDSTVDSTSQSSVSSRESSEDLNILGEGTYNVIHYLWLLQQSLSSGEEAGQAGLFFYGIKYLYPWKPH